MGGWVGQDDCSEMKEKVDVRSSIYYGIHCNYIGSDGELARRRLHICDNHPSVVALPGVDRLIVL